MPLGEPLLGSVALVTGSARGIGRAIALELARWGADVAVHALQNHGKAEEVAAEIRASGRKAIVVLGDVRDKAAMDGRRRLGSLRLPELRGADASFDRTWSQARRASRTSASLRQGPRRDTRSGSRLAEG